MSLAEKGNPPGRARLSTSRLFLVSAAVYLLLGLALQTVHLADMWLGLNPLVYTSASVAAQVLLIGWVSQAAMGLLYNNLIALPRLGGSAWGCLNVGLILVVVGQPLLAWTGSGLAGGLVVGGGLLELAGGTLFVADLVTGRRRGLARQDDHTQTPDPK